MLSTVRTPLGPAYGEHEAEDARTRGAQAGLDDRKILDVLRKDLGGAVGWSEALLLVPFFGRVGIACVGDGSIVVRAR